MKHRRGIAWILAVSGCLGAIAARAELPPERAYRTVAVAEGIYAFISPETNGPIPSGNVVAVVGDDGVLVVDSGRFPALARRMVAEIRQKTDKPVRYLVHTHWHLDHVVGDGEFRAAFPAMTFIATDFTRRKMIEKQIGYLRDIEPDLTFAESLTVYLGKREVRIAFLGEGNTAGDTVVFVPDSKVAITGDLLVSPVPYGYGCHPSQWIQTLGKLMATDATTIVPGHGPVMRDWDYAKRVTAVLEAIRAQVKEAARQGLSLDETRKRMHLERYEKEFAGDDYGRGKAFRDFFVFSAVERAYQEAEGKMAEE